MNIDQKLEVLKETASHADQFGLVLDKMIEATLSQHRLQLARYDQELSEFEQKFSMDSATFYRQFESGLLGDAMDYFEWSGLYELRQKLVQKIWRLEQAV